MKLCQIKLSIPKVPRPNADQGTIIIRDEGRKIALPKESNEVIVITGEGAWGAWGACLEKEGSQRVVEEGELPSQDVCRQLEHLAL